MSEGELLRDQLAACIDEIHIVDFTAYFIADEILARFDVRLREPQAEETL